MKNFTYNEYRFLQFVKTKQFLLNRLKDSKLDEPVFISKSEIKEKFFPNPFKSLNTLIEEGMLGITTRITNNGYQASYYKALIEIPIDLTLIKEKELELDDLELFMRECLKSVWLSDSPSDNQYFNCFLKNKADFIHLFFTVDKFSKRIHTPVTNLKKEYRKHLLINNQPTVALDVCQIQPMLLGKILQKEIGENTFSNWINSGEDIYNIIQQNLKLNSRDKAKDYFFKILFSKPNERFSLMFGNTEWIRWINSFKCQIVNGNPYSFNKPHSNLAWLLQSKEVKLMRKVWQMLMNENIILISVHDEVIVQASNQFITMMIMEEVFQKELTFFKIDVKSQNCFFRSKLPKTIM